MCTYITIALLATGARLIAIGGSIGAGTTGNSKQRPPFAGKGRGLENLGLSFAE